MLTLLKSLEFYTLIILWRRIGDNFSKLYSVLSEFEFEVEFVLLTVFFAVTYIVV